MKPSITFELQRHVRWNKWWTVAIKPLVSQLNRREMALQKQAVKTRKVRVTREVVQ